MASPSLSRNGRALGIGVVVAILALLWVFRAEVSRKLTGGPATSGTVNAGSAAGRRGSAHRRSGSGSSDPGADERRVLIRGTVVDAQTAQPVGGGEVVFAHGGSEATTRADESGRYQIEIPTGAYRAFVRGEGFVSVGAPARERLVRTPLGSSVGAAHEESAPLIHVSDDEAGVDLAVERSALVTGKVSNRVGDPIAGAVVRARGSSRPVGGSDIVKTAADGSFALQLPFGGYRVDVSHEDYAGIDDSHASIVVEPGKSDPLNLTLLAGCIVRGKVVGPTGSPFTEGSVDQGAPGSSEFRPATSIEPDGTFRFTTTAEGDVALRAWPWMSPPTSPETIHCSEGARHEVTLRIADDGSPDLDGTISTADGQPAGGAYVDIVALSPGAISQEERADADGNWEVYTMPAGIYQVTISVAGEGSVQRRVTVPSHDVALTLSGTGSIAGTVKGVTDRTFAMTVSGCSGDYAGGTPNPRLVAVHDGRFRVDGVPACSVILGIQSGTQVAQTSVAVKNKGLTETSLDLSPPPLVEAVPLPDPPPSEPEAEVLNDPPIAPPPDPEDARSDNAAHDDEVGGGDPGDSAGG